MNIIGDNVRRLRKIHNLNQIEFSRLIGVSQGSLSDIEAGKSKPAIETVISIHTKFGCSLEWLLKGTSTHISGQPSDINLTSSELCPIEIELISAFRKLDSNNQMEALEIVKLKLRSVI
ncbi:hypothetical protein BC351_28780 [Paenibacillus ferrarius]|uniref:HTH cro/C1-type domain-containing protein n=1 Tax=Paenibacillus ferrarius TaxID=1469647 RepID=A0A1V4HJ41_9BACL|nr:helix-turn-helix transcriptional regulator [Paenibacillus ferrarius]OPH56168.1 hypothetical protein BC351_28780 [Paenibacillus ferrarius]